MTWRPAAGSAVLFAGGVLLLYAVRPGVVENGVHSPRVWLVVLALLLAGPLLRALLQRVTGRRGPARFVGAAVPLAVAAALLAPSFQQRVLVEPFPTAAAEVQALAPVPPARSPAPLPPASPSPAAVAGPRPFSPQAPTASAAVGQPAPPRPTSAPSATARATAPRLLSSGAIEGIGHGGSGTNALYGTAAGTVLRFENVDIEGTPDPVVYLVPRGARTPEGGVRLGPLKAERGSFGYTLPRGVRGDRPWTVLVWCAPYDTPVAAADLR